MVKDIRISNFIISKKSNPFIIAEIGVNHNGKIALAKKMIDSAKRSGANCVKFQTFNAINLVTQDTPLAPYQTLNLKKKQKSQFEMLKKLQLNYQEHVDLMDYCKKKKILFLSTPYNFADVDMLNKLNVKAFKLASMHLTEPEFIEFVAKKGRPVIISTGMSNFKEVKVAVSILKKYLKNKFVILQCTTNYPASLKDSNISVLSKFNKNFSCHTGFSDHTNNSLSAITAISLGATVIEKHFTLNKNFSGPDHKCSLEPNEFLKYVNDLKLTKLALGNDEKKVTKEEKVNIKFMKRSIYVNKRLEKNYLLKLSDLEFKRPQNGIPSSKALKVIGKKLIKSINKNSRLSTKHINL